MPSFESQLTDYEKAEVKRILTEEKYDYLVDLEETCEGSRSYHYEIFPSNIGDNVYLVYRGKHHYISDPDSF